MLSEKQKLFVAHYVIHKSATEAAKAAGYSKKTAHSCGPRMLENAGIKKAIDKALEKQMERAELTGDMIIAQLRKLAFADLNKAYSKNGKLLNPHDMPEDVRAALSGLESDEIRAGGMKLGVTRKVKLSDKTKALELLGKHFKIFTEVVESKNAHLHVNTEPVSPEAAKAAFDKIHNDC